MRLLRNEKGIALAMVLILSLIALMVTAGLLYIITSGTQISGMQKRYKTALEAGGGGADLTYQFVAFRGDLLTTNAFLAELNTSLILSAVTTLAGCSGTNMDGTTFTGLAAKLNASSSTWSADCKDIVTTSPYYPSFIINPGNPKTYDFTFDLADALNPAAEYRVFSKIVDTVEGNSGPDTGALVSKGVVGSAGAEIIVVHKPFLYTVEIDSQNSTNPMERARLSILYQY